MGTEAIKTVVELTAYDRMSIAVEKSVGKSLRALKDFKKSADEIATKGISLQNFGSAVVGSQAMQAPIAAFAELEDGATRLKSVMMTVNGIPTRAFEKINSVAIDLGNRLPGTTNDFYNMFSEMIQGGLTAENIIRGTGQAAAYLAVQLKMPYDEVGRGVSKLREAAGVADNDMMKFLDVIQRTANVGVKFDEMQYAFAKSAGQLKNLNIQGVDAASEMAALFAMLIKSGASGETVGTGIATAMQSVFDTKKMALANAEAKKLGFQFQFLNKEGNFAGVENFIAQLGKLKGFSQQEVSNVLTPLMGPTGQDAQFMKSIALGGIGAFREMQNRMNEQADLNSRVSLQLGTLKSLWESLTGTFTNFLATIGGSLAPALKSIASVLNNIVSVVGNFLEKHKLLSQIIGWSIIVVGGLAAAIGALGITLGVVAKVAAFSSSGFIALGTATKWLNFQMWYLSASVKSWAIWGKIAAATQWLFNASLWGCPVVWIVAGLAAVVAGVVLMVKYWKPITAFFSSTWEKIKGVFSRFNEWFKGWGKLIVVPLLPFIGIPLLIINNWAKIKAFFSTLWTGIITSISKLGSKFFEAGKNIVKSIWQGIKSFANKPIEAIAGIVKKIRDFLPFSPAKIGPLKDLHRVKIMETIATSIKPFPVMKAMNSAMMPVRSQAGNYRTGGGGGGVSLVYSPVISISGAGAGTKEEFSSLLKRHETEIMRMITEANRKKERRTY